MSYSISSILLLVNSISVLSFDLKRCDKKMMCDAGSGCVSACDTQGMLCARLARDVPEVFLCSDCKRACVDCCTENSSSKRELNRRHENTDISRLQEAPEPNMLRQESLVHKRWNEKRQKVLNDSLLESYFSSLFEDGNQDTQIDPEFVIYHG